MCSNYKIRIWIILKQRIIRLELLVYNISCAGSARFSDATLNYIKLTNTKTQEEYLNVTPEGNLTEETCRQLLLEINEESRQHGYERIMFNLSKLKGPFSVKDLYNVTVSQEAKGLLPMRIAWVNDDPTWEKNWKVLEPIARIRKLPWRSFSQA